MPKARKQRPQPSQPQPKISGRADLLVVDQAPFLKKALLTCRRLRNELHKKQKLLADFEERDRDAYQQWYHAHFGKRLTQLREEREEVAQYQFILHHLSYAAHFHYETVPALYEELMQRRKDGTLYAYEPPGRQAANEEPSPDEDDDDGWDEAFDDIFGHEEDTDGEFSEEARRRFEDMFGGGKGAAGGNFFIPLVSRRVSDEDIRLKTCYRKLAKRLHPDHSELEESVRERRWHEIQDAYHQGDLDALLRVEAVCDMDATGLTPELGLARLRELSAYHKSHLVPLRKALSAAKRDIAFGFAIKGATRDIEDEIREDLKYEHQELQHQREYLGYTAKSIYEEICDGIREAEAERERAKEMENLRREAQVAKRRAAKVRAAERQAARQKAKREAEAAKDTQQMSFL